MGYFNDEHIIDCDSRTSDDDYLDRQDSVSSKPVMLTDRQIINTGKRGDYSYDVYISGSWVASAKNYHGTDEAADEIWYRSVTEGDPEDPGEWRTERCHNCNGPHATWRCIEIGDRLFAADPRASWSDPALGRVLCALRWRDFSRFRALIGSVTSETLIAYAASYQAFIRSYRPDTDLTITQVLAAWAKISAPAMQVAA